MNDVESMHDECNASEGNEQLNPDLPSKRQSPWLPWVLIATMTICVLLVVFVPAIRHARRSTQQMGCRNNLSFIGLALQHYHDTFQALPPAITYADDGSPMHSWRVRIVPFLVQNPLGDFYDFQEAWNGPANGLLADEVPDFWGGKFGVMLLDADYFMYRCPSAPHSQNRMYTNYVMLIDDRAGKPNGPPNRPGSTPLSLDPKSAVIVIEIADSDIHWMEPRDVLLSELSMKINDRSKRSLSSYHGGACVVHADGSVELLDDATTEERLRELLTQ
jgi:hypothetical protein